MRRCCSLLNAAARHRRAPRRFTLSLTPCFRYGSRRTSLLRLCSKCTSPLLQLLRARRIGALPCLPHPSALLSNPLSTRDKPSSCLHRRSVLAPIAPTEYVRRVGAAVKLQQRARARAKRAHVSP